MIQVGMRGIKKCPTIIYRVKKYRDTGIPRYFLTSSIAANFCKKSYRTNHLQCCHRFSLPYNVNDIRCKLSASGRGCHVDGIYVGVVMYVDDLLLISSTCSDLRRMTKISEDVMT